MVEVICQKEGLAGIIGNLIMQNIRRDKKANIAMKTHGTAVIEIKDLGFSVTIELKGEN